MSENTGLTAYTVYLKADVYEAVGAAELVPDSYDTLEENICLKLDADLQGFIQDGQRYKVTITRAEPNE